MGWLLTSRFSIFEKLTHLEEEGGVWENPYELLRDICDHDDDVAPLTNMSIKIQE